MFHGFFNGHAEWLAPMFSALVLLLCLVLIRGLRRERDGLFQEKEALHDFVHDVSEAFIKSDETHIDFLLKRVLFYAQRTSMAGAGAIFFMEPDGEELSVRAVSGLFPPLAGDFDKGLDSANSKFQYARKLVNEQRAVKGKGIIGEVAERGAPLLIADAERDPRVPRFKNDLFRIQSILLAPMRFQDTVMGVLVVVNRIDDSPFVQSDLSLLQALADQASVTIYFAKFNEELEKKRVLDDDLRVARKIQGSLLPMRLPAVKGLDLKAFSVPAREVGGDYYDFASIDDKHLGILVADVSGKGVAAAIVMSICRSVFQANAQQSLSPAHVLKAINRVISRDAYEDMFISMLYVVLNTETFEMKLARAGHMEPILLSREEQRIQKVKSRGIALGLADNDTFDSELEESTIELKPGDIFAGYTDGLFEIPDAPHGNWNIEQLQRIILSNATAHPEHIVDRVRQELGELTEDVSQYDDMTLLVVKRTGEEQSSVL